MLDMASGIMYYICETQVKVLSYQITMINRNPLTPKQTAFLQFLRDYVRETGLWPTYNDISDRFDFRSPNSVTQNLQALQKKGYLRKDLNGYQLTTPEEEQQRRKIRIRGVITAGCLQEAVEENLGTITIDLLNRRRYNRMFALRVKGSSMVNEGIQDGDLVLLIDEDIPNGGIGAVLYNGQTTLKRIYTDEQGLHLVPANDEFPDVKIHPALFEEVRVLGRYVGRVNHSGRMVTAAAA